jgi:hypothetical protein
MTKTSDEREQRLAARRAGEARSLRRARLRMSVSAWARFWGSWYYVPLAIGLFSIPVGRLSGVLDAGTRGEAAMIAVMAIGLVMTGLFGALVVTYIAMQRDLRRWSAGLAALPFQVIDYEECLGDPPDAHRPRVRLQLVFADDAPTDEELAAILLAGSAGWEVDHDGRAATLTPGPGAAYKSDNRQLAAWFDALTNGELRALHARFPLVSVRVLNQLWFD